MNKFRFLVGALTLAVLMALGTTPVGSQTVERARSSFNLLRVVTILQAASGYHNWGTTQGSSGYGIRDNAGTIEIKNSGGSWASPGTAYTGTPNQIILTGTVFSTPQDIGTASNVTFGTLTAATLYGSALANGDIVIEGTAHATKTSSDVSIQPTGGSVKFGTNKLVVDLNGSALSASGFYDAAGNVGLLTSGTPQLRGIEIRFASLAMRMVAPTIASGFGTSPSIVASNGTAVFTLNVGTGGVASDGVITMPAATTGWACQLENRTAVAGGSGTRADVRTGQSASTTTSVTLVNYTISSGSAIAWADSTVLVLQCMGY
jgi:hypothetical protein